MKMTSDADNEQQPKGVVSDTGLQPFPVWHLLIVIGIAAFVRALFWQFVQRFDPLALWPVVDERTYSALSDEILRNGWGSLRHFLPFWQPPGYVAWLALFKQAGFAFREIVWLQMGVGVVNSVLVFYGARRMASGRSAWIPLACALLFTMHPTLLYYETRLLKPVWNILFLLIVLVAPARRGFWGIMGGVLAVAITFEAYFLLLLPIACLRIPRPIQRRTMVALLLPALTITPLLGVANTRAAGRFVLISKNGAANLFIGNNPDWIRTYNTLPGWSWRHLMHRHAADDAPHTLPSVIQEHRFVQETMAFIRTEPIEFLTAIVQKTLLTFSPRELPRDGMDIRLLPFGQIAYLFNIIATVLVLPVVWMMRRSQPAMALAILMIALVNIGFFPTSRYRLLAYPLICMGITGFKRQRIFFILMAAGAILAIAGHGMAGRLVDHPSWRAFAYTEAGRHQLVQNDIDAARDWFDQALAARPILPALMDRGLLAFEIDGDAVLARELFAAALELEPDYPDPYFYLGVIALAHQQLNTAQREFQEYLVARQHVGYEDNVDTEMLARSLLYFILLEARAGPTEAAERAWHRARALIDVPEPLRERINALESRFPNERHR